jgi:hypothetical protein
MKLLYWGVPCAALLLCACHSETGHVPTGAQLVQPRFDELSTQVPADFADARKWNQSRICPEGSRLSPFTRYSFEPGQDSHGFKYYYGRSCNVIEGDEAETAGRKLASTKSEPVAPSAPETGSLPTITVLPHGPYIWWYENGKRMETGSFENGTLAIGSSRYEPDGSKTPSE